MGMGYQGFVKFDTSNIVLATGSSVNMVIEPIYSNANWGAGWYNAAIAHYADNAIRFEGNIDIELQMGASGVIWEFLRDWVIEERASSKTLTISPDGSHVYHYTHTAPYDLQGAWCSSASLSTNEGSFVTASLGVMALDRSMTDPTWSSGSVSDHQDYSSYTYIDQKYGVIGVTPSLVSGLSPLNPSGENVNPIPYWRTLAQLLTGTYVNPFSGGDVPQSGLETVEWSIDIANNPVILYTCNGVRHPSAVLMGAMDVTGNVVLYNTAGVFDPILGPLGDKSLTQPYLYAQNTWFRITIQHMGSGGTPYNVFIEVPAVVVDSDDYGLKGMNEVTNRGFGIKGLGGRVSTSPSLVLPPAVISDYSDSRNGTM